MPRVIDVDGQLRLVNDQDQTLLTLDAPTGTVYDKSGSALGLSTAASSSIATATSAALPRQRHVKPTILSTMQSGHSWTTGGGTGTWALNSTDNFWAGTQSIKFTTDAAGSLPWVQSPVFSAIDFTGVDITVWVYITSGLSNLRRIQAILTSDTFSNYNQANVYDGGYQATPGNAIRQGEWFPLRFNLQQIAAAGNASGAQTVGSPTNSAIVRMRLILQDYAAGAVSGYIGAVTYQTRPSTFSNGVVSLTFDDCFATTYTIAAPYLAIYGFSGSEFVIKDLVGNGTAMSLAQLQALEAVYGWECCAHAYTVANHTFGFDRLSTTALEAELAGIKLWLIQNGFNGYDHFAYPLGHLATTDQQVGKYFSTGRTLYSNPGSEMIRPAAPLRLRAYEVLPTTTLQNVKDQIDAAQSSGSWLILVFHNIVAANPTGSSTTTAIFQGIVDYISTKSIDCAPIGDVWRAMA